MRCPFCNSNDDRVLDSRPAEDGRAIRRRRECLNCHKRFTTYEKIEEMPLIVSKRDGSVQPFDREKLIQSIMKSCVKRPVSTQTIEAIVNTIEEKAGREGRREIRSQEIGEQVLAELRRIDTVAYVRFASVYRDFEDLASFLRELEKLRAEDAEAR